MDDQAAPDAVSLTLGSDRERAEDQDLDEAPGRVQPGLRQLHMTDDLAVELGDERQPVDSCRCVLQGLGKVGHDGVSE